MMDAKKNNIYTKNFKSDTMDADEPASETWLATTQNNYNTRQLNNGQTMRGSSSLKSLFSGSKRKGIAMGVMVFVLLAGVVAICASFVMLGMLGVQRMHIRTLQSELETMKAENIVCKNDTTSLTLQLTFCAKELLGKQHELEVNSAQCEREKADITAQLKAEIRESEHQKEITQEKLNVCESDKEELSQRLESETQNAAAEKRRLGDQVEQCKGQQREILQGREQEIQRQVEERVAARPSFAVNREPNWSSSQSRPNGAGGLESSQTVLLLSMLLLSFLLKVLNAV